jgi:hypothetical protein
MLATVATPATSRRELVEWWSPVRSHRDHPDRPRVSGTPVGSSQTLAVDSLGGR